MRTLGDGEEVKVMGLGGGQSKGSALISKWLRLNEEFIQTRVWNWRGGILSCYRVSIYICMRVCVCVSIQALVWGRTHQCPYEYVYFRISVLSSIDAEIYFWRFEVKSVVGSIPDTGSAKIKYSALLKNEDMQHFKNDSLVGFYGISTVVSYLMPCSFYAYILNV